MHDVLVNRMICKPSRKKNKKIRPNGRCGNGNVSIARDPNLLYRLAVMPATPRERLRNPLRQLRCILGDFGAPMSQEEFSAQTNLSIHTVRAVENQRLPLSRNVLSPIAKRWLVRWDPQNGGWLFLETNKLYSRELGVRVRPLRGSMPDKKLIRKSLHDRLDNILDAAGEKALPGEAMLLNQLLRDHVEETALPVDLNSTELAWSLHHGPETSPTWPIASYPERQKKRTQSVPKQKTGSKATIKRAPVK